MVRTGFFLPLLLAQLAFAPLATAADFGWHAALAEEGRKDPATFRERLKARFGIDDREVHTVLDRVRDHADAYMAFRLREMSRRPIGDVLSRYSTHRDRGWGVLAKSLGIKPGSREFHALKQGHDLYPAGHSAHDTPGGKPDGKGKGKGKGKDK